jgi:hypothetical protein
LDVLPIDSCEVIIHNVVPVVHIAAVLFLGLAPVSVQTLQLLSSSTASVKALLVSVRFGFTLFTPLACCSGTHDEVFFLYE